MNKKTYDLKTIENAANVLGMMSRPLAVSQDYTSCMGIIKYIFDILHDDPDVVDLVYELTKEKDESDNYEPSPLEGIYKGLDATLKVAQSVYITNTHL